MTTASKNDDKKLESDKGASTLQLFYRCARIINQQALSRVDALASRPALRPAHSALLQHIDLDGTRLTVLAARLGVSKQAVSQLVDEMETLGVLERASDPNDARAKLVRFTPKGKRGMLDGQKVFKDIEEELGEKIGRQKLKDLRKIVLNLLEQVDAHFEGEPKA